MSWVFTGNEIDKVIPPLQSRVILVDCSCSTRPKREAHLSGIARRLRHILSAEGVTGFSDEALRGIVELHYPDIRQTINNLERKYASYHAA